MTPGTLPWLLRHDLRVAWREFTATSTPGSLIATGAILFALVHLALWFMAQGLRGSLTPLHPAAIYVAVALLLVATPLMLALAMSRSVQALFERGDMDLLASSPLSSRVIFAGRVLGVALTVCLMSSIFLLPIAHVGVMVGVPQLLGLYPTVAALSLAVASVGMILTVWLVRVFGARRARVLAQVVGSLAGGGFFMLAMIPNLLGNNWLDSLAANMANIVPLFEAGGPLAPESLLWFPARALFFDPLSLLLALGGSALVFWLTTRFLHRAFMTGTLEPTTAVRSRRPSSQGHYRFRQGTRLVMLLKEWKLILRDPYLVSQTLLQVIYFIPMAVIIWRPATDSSPFSNLEGLLGAGAVLLAGTFSATLARICLAGEEAPDLLRASPVPSAEVHRIKLTAAVLPSIVLVLPLVIGLVSLNAWLALLMALIALASAIASSLIRLWNPIRVRRSDLFKRARNQGDTILNLIEGVVPVGLGLGAYGLSVGQWFGPLGIGISLAATLLAWWRSRGWEEDLAY